VIRENYTVLLTTVQALVTAREKAHGEGRLGERLFPSAEGAGPCRIRRRLVEGAKPHYGVATAILIEGFFNNL
jgi:hypothetical protein